MSETSESKKSPSMKSQSDAQSMSEVCMRSNWPSSISLKYKSEVPSLEFRSLKVQILSPISQS